MDLEAVVARWLSDATVSSIERLTGGHVNDVYRVETAAGVFVLRVAAVGTTRAAVAWEHTLTSRLAAVLPEVSAPVPTPDGRTIVELEGRIASLMRFAIGRPADGFDPDHRAAAAETLGRVHRALRELGDLGSRPAHPRWVDLDWREHRLWSWGSADRVTLARRIDLDAFDRALSDLPAAVRDLTAASLPAQALHGDYSDANLLVLDGKIRAVLDWDECRSDWRAWEVAASLWAWCRLRSGELPDATTVAAFLEAYERGAGALLPAERASLGLLTRATRLWEAMWALGRVQRGADADLAYFELNVDAVKRLRDFEVE